MVCGPRESVSTPWRIPPDRIVLSQGALQHPESQWLQLTVWHLSGDVIQEAYPTRVIDMIQTSRRPSTNRIYDSTWRNFFTWASKLHIDMSSLTVPRILEYLLEGIEMGLSPSTIKRQVAALATVLSCDDSSSLAHHPMIRSFINGVVNTNAPTIHRYPSWDLSYVLQALTGSPFESLKTCDLSLLSMT